MTENFSKSRIELSAFFFIALTTVPRPASGCSSLYSSKFDATAIQLAQLSVVLKDFKRVCGFFPTTEQGLQELVEQSHKTPICQKAGDWGGGFLKKIPKDPWDAPLKYSSDSRTFRLEASHGIFITEKEHGSDEVGYAEGRPSGRDSEGILRTAIAIGLGIVVIGGYLLRRKRGLPLATLRWIAILLGGGVAVTALGLIAMGC